MQDQLDGWCGRINARVHRTTRAVVGERLREERQRMRVLPATLPDTDEAANEPLADLRAGRFEAVAVLTI